MQTCATTAMGSYTISGIPGVDIQPLSEKYLKSTTDLLINSFRVNEPLCKTMGMTADESAEIFQKFPAACAEFGVSFVATDTTTDEVIGCRLSTIKERSEGAHSMADDFNPRTLPTCGEKVFILINFVDGMINDVFDLVPDAQRIFKFEVLAVHEAYWRRGIAQRLVEISLKKAQAMSCDHVMVFTTSFKSQGLFDKLGFVSLRRQEMRPYTLKDGRRPFADLPDDNTMATLNVKRL